MNSSKSVGSDTLLQLIKNYSKNSGIKQAVTVGVIGYPNVGKSSLINRFGKTHLIFKKFLLVCIAN